MPPSTPSTVSAAAPTPSMLLKVIAACAVWALVSWLSSANLDGYHDMLENYAWAQPLQWGTHKHPPFFAWVVGLWFTLFPQADWAYRLLSYTNVGVALWGVWVLGRRLGLSHLAPLGAALLLWTFPYTSLAGKFNANSQLLSLWPWAAALLLASWQEKGWRGALYSAALGLLAAASMLSKYYSGVFLAGFLVPTLLTAPGRRWLCTPRPYLALAVFAAALAPHVAWVAHHQWTTLGYAMDQGGGGTNWRYVARFLLSPLFYWLPAWLALVLVYARLQRKAVPVATPLPVRRLLWRIWMPRGWDDALFWLAVMPWLLTLGFGIAGVAELSTPWAIPIGYAFALLWLRNLDALLPGTTAAVLAALRRAWWPVLGGVLVLGVVAGVLSARKGDEGFYRPSSEAAQAIVEGWQRRHPDLPLQWVGGAWAENALVSFYAQPHLRTVPGLPDEVPARLLGLTGWEGQAGLLLCPRGPVQGDESGPSDASAGCEADAQAWLQARGLPVHPVVLTLQRQGWRFPKARPFAYAVFDVLPRTAPTAP